MAAKADFHNHSTASDGRLTPTQIVDLAAANGVRVFALTDHDSTEGIAEALKAAEKHPGFFLIPGVELSCDTDRDQIHILGYFTFEMLKNQELQDTLSAFREGRLERGRLMTEKLAELGAPVSWPRVLEIAGEASVGRPHVAQALVEAGHVASIQEAFDRYISNDGPAYVERERLEAREAVAALRNFGAPAVLAHPRYMKDPEALLVQLEGHGLAGLEVFHKDSDAETIARFAEMAQRFGLSPTGGSDYHALPREAEREPGITALPDSVAKDFLEKHLPWVPTAELS